MAIANMPAASNSCLQDITFFLIAWFIIKYKVLRFDTIDTRTIPWTNS